VEPRTDSCEPSKPLEASSVSRLVWQVATEIACGACGSARWHGNINYTTHFDTACTMSLATAELMSYVLPYFLLYCFCSEKEPSKRRRTLSANTHSILVKKGRRHANVVHRRRGRRHANVHSKLSRCGHEEPFLIRSLLLVHVQESGACSGASAGALKRRSKRQRDLSSATQIKAFVC